MIDILWGILWALGLFSALIVTVIGITVLIVVIWDSIESIAGNIIGRLFP